MLKTLLSRNIAVPIGLVLISQAVALHMLSIPERDLPVPGLRQVPLQLGAWKAAGEEEMAPEVAAYLKPDEYVIRDYGEPGSADGINLFLAYFKSLQNVYGPHSPSVCLPGAGWLVRSAKVISIDVPGGRIPINEYELEKSGDRILTIYWYQNNRDVWAEEFQAKLKLLPDLLRFHRSDVSLVRVITPVRDAAAEKARARSMRFIRLVYPELVSRFSSAG